MKIIQKLGVDWTKVASSLQFEYSVVSTIEFDYSHRTEQACEQMFHRWLNGEACETITWERLIEAFYDSEHAVLADKVKKMLEK